MWMLRAMLLLTAVLLFGPAFVVTDPAYGKHCCACGTWCSGQGWDCPWCVQNPIAHSTPKALRASEEARPVRLHQFNAPTSGDIFDSSVDSEILRRGARSLYAGGLIPRGLAVHTTSFLCRDNSGLRRLEFSQQVS